MHSIPEIIAEILKEEFLAGTNPPDDGPWPITVGQLPDMPHSAIGVFDLDALSQGRIHRTGETQGAWGYQLRIRSKKYQDARQKTKEISAILDSVRQLKISVGENRYFVWGIHQETRSTFIGPDMKDRMNFTINGSATYKEIGV